MSELAAALECRGVTLAYGQLTVLHDLSLAVAAGETVALLGPSGSGKSSLLYAIAGFLRPSAGEIAIAGRVVSSRREWVPPERRSIGMVFQSYALWPHMTALETVAYPLRRSGLAAAEARRRAQDLLDAVGIGRLADRRPAELSGGEQQRVGLCRALARDPDLYLFDEPTAHLDSALRANLQKQLTNQRQQSRAAALYATHDVAEALAVADRIALLRDGRIVQVGTPTEIYERPVDLWAARLTGPASTLDIFVGGLGDKRATVRVGEVSTEVVIDGPAQGDGPGSLLADGRRSVLVRPGWARLGGRLWGVVEEVWYRGEHTDYRLQTAAGDLTARQAGMPSCRPGEHVGWSLERVWLTTSDAPSEGP